MTTSFYEQLSRQSEMIGIHLDDRQIEQLYRYYTMLIETNKVMNLTAITEEAEVITKHFIDSMSVVKAENVSRETFSDGKMIDIGTGAGFPGMVLKIVFPEINMTLSDSLRKRLNFLDEVISSLEIKGIELIHGRAEDLAQRREYREQYDFSVSRAVANLSTLSEYDIPFVKKGGLFIAYKAGKIDEELDSARNAIKILGGQLESKVCFVLPESDMERTILLIRKKEKTPGIYPRKAGTPSKTPL